MRAVGRAIGVAMFVEALRQVINQSLAMFVETVFRWPFFLLVAKGLSRCGHFWDREDLCLREGLQKFVFCDFNRFCFARGFGFCIYVVPFAAYSPSDDADCPLVISSRNGLLAGWQVIFLAARLILLVRTALGCSLWARQCLASRLLRFASG